MTKLEMKGFDEVMRQLEKMGADISSIENRALKAGGEIVRDAVKEETPKQIGNLSKNTRSSRVKEDKYGTKYVEVDHSKKGYYAKFLEFGTLKMKANPFMSRGYLKSKDRATREMENELKRGLKL